jgi:hypothetical protein
MKRIFAILSVLSLAIVMTVTAVGQTTSAPQIKPEHLSKGQLNTLISTAKTPAEHHRIAQFYQARAQDYLAQSKEHEAMVAAYKSNPSLVNNKNQASTINHCEYFVQTFKDLAVKSQELAQLHEEMATETEQK